MRYATMALAFALLPGAVLAQENVLPYETGSVEKFLEANKAKGVASVVLYNFNLESG